MIDPLPAAPEITKIDVATVDRLLASAAQSTRRRAHLLLHDSPEDSVQRLLIALHHGTYLPPHRHHRRLETLVMVLAISIF